MEQWNTNTNHYSKFTSTLDHWITDNKSVGRKNLNMYQWQMVVIRCLEDDLVLAREDFTITITVLATPWLLPGSAVLVRRLAEGDWDRPPAAAAALGRYTGAGVVTAILQNTIFREGDY